MDDFTNGILKEFYKEEEAKLQKNENRLFKVETISEVAKFFKSNDILVSHVQTMMELEKEYLEKTIIQIKKFLAEVEEQNANN